MNRLALSALIFGVLAISPTAVSAQNSREIGDSPDHGVARISLLSGDVTVRRGDSGEDIDAELNAPLVERDHLLTGRNARAEVQLDWANIVRLAPDSELRLSELADQRYRVELTEGLMTLRVLRDSDARLEINTPTATIRPRDKGTYRIVVQNDYSTEVSVRSGDLDVFVGRDSTRLRSGDALLISGDPSSPRQTSFRAPPRDDWDVWNESRDRELERSDSYKYVSRHIYGADDLYNHGRWVYDSPYGWVWAPNVAFDWAPYRNGRWINTAYYGWTWVSSDPWGWAPYHYGRWYQASRHGWVWYPGPVNVRYYWKPALVGFFGWGDGDVRIGFGFGNVGWVPLAPYEVYRPWYGRPNVTIVNVIQRVNVIDAYRNARFVGGRDGFTGVRAGEFGRRRTAPNDFVRIDGRDARVLDSRSRGNVNPPREAPRAGDRAATPQGRGRQADNAQPPRQGRSGAETGFADNSGGNSASPVSPRGNGRPEAAREPVGREAPPVRIPPQQAAQPERQRQNGVSEVIPGTLPTPGTRREERVIPTERRDERAEITQRSAPERSRVERSEVERSAPQRGQVERPVVVERPAPDRGRVEQRPEVVERSVPDRGRVEQRPAVVERSVPDRGRVEQRPEVVERSAPDRGRVEQRPEFRERALPERPRVEAQVDARQERREVVVGRSPGAGASESRRPAAQAAPQGGGGSQEGNANRGGRGRR